MNPRHFLTDKCSHLGKRASCERKLGPVRPGSKSGGGGGHADRDLAVGRWVSQPVAWWTPLHAAARAGDVEGVADLLARGCGASKDRRPDRICVTPLHAAAMWEILKPSICSDAERHQRRGPRWRHAAVLCNPVRARRRRFRLIDARRRRAQSRQSGTHGPAYGGVARPLGPGSGDAELRRQRAPRWTPAV